MTEVSICPANETVLNVREPKDITPKDTEAESSRPGRAPGPFLSRGGATSRPR